MTLEAKLKEIKERLNNATPGAWQWGSTNYNFHISVYDKNGLLKKDICYYNTEEYSDEFDSDYEQDTNNAKLIAHAPTDIAMLLELLECYEDASECLSDAERIRDIVEKYK